MTPGARCESPARPRPPSVPQGPVRSGSLAWRSPWLYEAYFAVSPLARALRRREMTAVLAAVDAVIRPTDIVLEAGAGPGTYTRHIARRSRRVVAVDCSPAMLARLSHRMRREGAGNVEVRWGRVPDALAALGGFDGILAAGVLDYLRDLDEALGCLCRLVRPGGWAVFTVPRARALPRLAALVEGTVVQRAHGRSPEEVSSAAAHAGLDLRVLDHVALGGAVRTLVALAAKPRRSPVSDLSGPGAR